jgi:putative ABC transport system permease protein
MARTFFGGVDAVGRRFRRPQEPDAWTEVIGVVHDSAPANMSTGDTLVRQPHVFYRAYAQQGLAPTTVVARTSGDAARLVAAMQRELRAVDVMLPVLTARTMARDLELAQAPPRMIATFLAVLGGLGLLPASIVLYAIVSYAVARRAREIGIRMALGARSRQVIWSIARGVAGLIAVGTGIGLGLSVLLMLVLRASSSGSADIGIGNIDVYRPAVDPVALLAIAALTAGVGMLAAFVPGRRAARMDPLPALRHD